MQQVVLNYVTQVADVNDLTWQADYNILTYISCIETLPPRTMCSLQVEQHNLICTADYFIGFKFCGPLDTFIINSIFNGKRNN